MNNLQDKNGIARLSIKELFETKDEYIIPIYQRNYAWTDTEVGQLIDDIHRHTQGQYYLGSLTVKKRTDGCFEVIDGQQRLTTLYLLLSVLKSPFNLELSFEHREASSNELSIVKQNGELTDTNSSQIATIYHYLKSGNKKLFGDDANRRKFLEKLLTTVQIIRTEIPENTDLNQYFERMNNRGEQLEHHEVIKAKLMSQLPNDDQAVFSAIWNACSDMSRYAVSSFSSDERQALFEDKGEYFWLYENFDNIKKNFPKTQKAKKDSDTSTDSQSDDTSKLSEILKQTHHITIDEKSVDKQERFTSIIDFPNFLAQVLYLFLKDKSKNKIKDGVHRLDDGNLIEQFKQSGLFDDADEIADKIKAFAVHLLTVRVLFDRHVIKHDGLDSKDDWYIYQFKKSDKNNSNNYHANVFDNPDKDKQIKMLQTMFHYSFPAKNYKYWLFGYLKWLNDESKSELENHKETGCAPRLSADKHINFLEKLCDQFYFNRFYNNGHGDEYFDIIYKTTELEKIQNHEFLHQGTAVANFIFNRLDYILWRKEWRKDKSVKFKFTARNSVEHYYPQNPPNGKAPDNVDHFGNLCLITHSQNSSLSNKMPSEKKAGYDVERYPSLSLKQREMFKYDEKNWNEGSIIKHGEAMIKLLNQEISATQSDA